MEVTQEMIDAWKEKYRFVYRATINGTDYYFRTLSRDDYIEIQLKVAAQGQNFDNELEVVKVCLLEPKIAPEELTHRAGVVSALSEKIMLRSGFVAVEEEEL